MQHIVTRGVAPEPADAASALPACCVPQQTVRGRWYHTWCGVALRTPPPWGRAWARCVPAVASLTARQAPLGGTAPRGRLLPHIWRAAAAPPDAGCVPRPPALYITCVHRLHQSHIAAAAHHSCRPSAEDLAASTRRQCRAAGAPFPWLRLLRLSSSVYLRCPRRLSRTSCRP